MIFVLASSFFFCFFRVQNSMIRDFRFVVTMKGIVNSLDISIYSFFMYE